MTNGSLDGSDWSLPGSRPANRNRIWIHHAPGFAAVCRAIGSAPVGTLRPRLNEKRDGYWLVERPTAHAECPEDTGSIPSPGYLLPGILGHRRLVHRDPQARRIPEMDTTVNLNPRIGHQFMLHR